MTDLPLGAESGLAVYATANRPGMTSCVYSSAATLETSNESVFSYWGHMWRVMFVAPPEAEDDDCDICVQCGGLQSRESHDALGGIGHDVDTVQRADPVTCVQLELSRGDVNSV